MEHTRKIRAFLCIGYVWWTICISLGFGQIENLSSGWWSGIETENVLGKTSFEFWSGYFTTNWFFGTAFSHTQWEGFSLVEADDYGYREIGTMTPRQWIARGWTKLQTKTIEFAGGVETGELSVGDYKNLETHWYTEAGIHWQEWTGKIGYKNQEIFVSLQQEFWFLRCLWQWNIKGAYSEGLSIKSGLFLRNQKRDLQIGYETICYQTYQQREIATFFWYKYLQTIVFYGEIGLSLWDAGRFRIGIGKKW